MNEVNAILATSKALTLVVAKFPGSPKHYSYKTQLDMTDITHVVVESPNSGLTVVEVVKVDDLMTFTGQFQLKWIVDTVSFTEYQKAQEVEREIAIQVNKHRATTQMNQLRQQLEDEMGTAMMQDLTSKVRL